MEKKKGKNQGCNSRHSLQYGAAHSVDQVRKSTELIKSQFPLKVLIWHRGYLDFFCYNAFRRMESLTQNSEICMGNCTEAAVIPNEQIDVIMVPLLHRDIEQCF
ncbi:hypothetical protein AVEN_90338-1 [Araneus ventricosus]|uniref:Uncharacterized protein n=1 Tax=Araneus ventricosus TaxID=182803 RepID=A0A4Y2C8F3_ARAVE|nr:hypothetical protein AVEN_7698-1 [Araneus ventricosus]GBO42221.1 hypothetical protein AVEN_90338-1 [Araneus ventricosus]